jgi:hypothetical protein
VKKTRILTVAVVAVVVVLCMGAVGAYAAKTAGDMTAPVTTATVAETYAGEVAFDLHATDASGVSYVYYRFDKNKTNLTTVATDTVHTAVDVHVALPAVAAVDPHPEMIQLPLGQHTVRFWAQDTEGNVEVQNVKTFTVDPAVTLASSAAVVKAGKYFTLSGTLKPAMMVGVSISAKKPGAKFYSALTTSECNADGVFMYKMKASLKGTWSFRAGYVNEALGVAGNSSLVKVKVK